MANSGAGRAKRSAGILLYRHGSDGVVEVLLGHPGGPYFARKDAGAWGILKGEYEPTEQPLQVALREFTEETGHPAPPGPYLPLGDVRLSSGKTVTGWAATGDLDPATAVSNTCEIEWPPRSGRSLEIPEVDRVQWFPLAAARERITRSQEAFLDRLAAALDPVG